jgi:hypothetical protein
MNLIKKLWNFLFRSEIKGSVEGEWYNCADVPIFIPRKKEQLQQPEN